MPRYFSTTRTQNRVSKPGVTAAGSRSSSASPFSSTRRSKSLVQEQAYAKALNENSDDEGAEAARDAGRVVPTFNVASVQDVTGVMQYATRSMFSELPERAGMNSVRISEVLNFQRNLPRLVSIPHIHAIISASSDVERDIQSRLADGSLVKLKVTGRGNDTTGLGEVLMSCNDYNDMLRKSGLAPETTSALMGVIQQNPRASTFPSYEISTSHAAELLKSGFLVSSSLLGSRNLSLSGSSLTGHPTISRAASGTFAAIGGDAAFEQLGGVGSGQRSRSEPHISSRTGELVLSVPNIGAYLRLVDAGRSHLMELLRSFQHRQAPLYLLRERWDGAVDSDNRVSQAKQLRGEFSQILPSKTKKWKLLKGLNFDWALEECLGAGMIELFETHSVGFGVRSLT